MFLKFRIFDGLNLAGPCVKKSGVSALHCHPLPVPPTPLPACLCALTETTGKTRGSNNSHQALLPYPQPLPQRRLCPVHIPSSYFCKNTSSLASVRFWLKISDLRILSSLFLAHVEISSYRQRAEGRWWWWWWGNYSLNNLM